MMMHKCIYIGIKIIVNKLPQVLYSQQSYLVTVLVGGTNLKLNVMATPST